MNIETRKLLDRAFSGTSYLAILLLAAALVVILAPIFARGARSFVFTATVEHRRLVLERFERGNRDAVETDIREAARAREPVYECLRRFENDLEAGDAATRRRYAAALRDFKKALAALLGPAPGAGRQLLPRHQYGQTRWDRALVKLDAVLQKETWDYSNPATGGVRKLVPRQFDFAGTALDPAFEILRRDLDKMLLPRRTVYWRFLTDESADSHFFGGIRPELLGTIYLTLGAMLFAVPMGLIAAIYLTEYARETRLLAMLRTCINTLAGVPSIVFGLFGLAFFINFKPVLPAWVPLLGGHTLGPISEGKTVLAGSLTLALMILPTVIRASEEAIRTVPLAYKEAALSLGAGRWHTILTVILPAALPGILTGTVISMGRAAGETAPIIFTAAVSVGQPLKIWEVFSQPTPALSWNIYNLCTEHEAVDEIRHVQYGMVATLVAIVLLLNLAAIILRARVSQKLRG